MIKIKKNKYFGLRKTHKKLNIFLTARKGGARQQTRGDR